MPKSTGHPPRGTQPPTTRKQRRPIWPRLLFGLFVLVSIGLGALAGVVLGTLRNTPKLEDLAYSPSVASEIYDANDKLITKLHAGENRTPVPITQIPQHLQDAVVAVEDASFYSHHGINPLGILRALLVDLKERRKAQGGSTITQELIKATLLTNDKLWSRKVKEAILAIQLERAYTKEEILELYLNQIYFGHGAYGVEAAAQTYFGKPVGQLDLAQCALVAGVMNGPSIFSPYIDMDAALRRRGIVLSRMRKLGFITPEQYAAAEAEKIVTVGLKGPTSVAPYFLEYIREELIERFGVHDVYKGGLVVHTTLDLRTQATAEAAVGAGLPKSYVDSHGLQQPEGALISLDPDTGYIRAMVGGRGDDKFNRATQALRQPGSAFKPFVYVTALENGYTPDSLVKDEPISYPTGEGKTWTPQNYDRRFRGTITLRTALENSINTIAVKVLDQVGIAKVIEMAKRLGITSLVEQGAQNDLNLSLALGGLTKGVSPLEMAVAYGTFANGGYRVKPIAITRVEDRYGNLLETARPEKVSVLDPVTAFTITDMLRGVVERGTGTGANIGRPAAGKTGTTSDNTNAWFAGFTPDLVTVVWLGNDEQARTIREGGAVVGSARAASIWREFMSKTLLGTQARNFMVPDNMSPSHTTTTPAPEAPATEPLQPSAEPGTTPAATTQEPSQDVEEVLVCKDSGQLATVNCPTDSVMSKLYDKPTAEEVDASGVPIPGTQRPQEACTLHPGALLATQ